LKGALVVDWSLVFGLWSLVFGFWSLCFVLCALPFAVHVCCLLDKRKPAASFRWQRVIRESFLRAFGLSAQEHDHQPATSMVVMPMSIVAVTCSEHRPRLYLTSKQLVKFPMVNPRNLSGR
jgi:hypothetical protein